MKVMLYVICIVFIIAFTPMCFMVAYIADGRKFYSGLYAGACIDVVLLFIVILYRSICYVIEAHNKR